MMSILPLLIVLVALPGTAWGESLQQNLERAIDQPAFNPGSTSVVVVDATKETKLAAINPDLRMNPASCAKILTATAALSTLGPNHRFVTSFFADRPPRRGTIDTLYVHGTGDPFLVTQELWRMIHQLKARGVTNIADGVVIDDSFFAQNDYPR